MSTERRLAVLQQDREWVSPAIIMPDDHETLETLLESGEVMEVVDQFERIVANLHAERLVTLDEDIRLHTRWVHFPWSRKLVRYPDSAAHMPIRTSRNRPVVSSEEQQRLYDARIAVFGLSVGGNILQQFARSGTGGSYYFGDPDTLDLTNLNRMPATMADIGLNKSDILAKHISEQDPYVAQTLLRQGYVPLETDALLDSARPQLIIEEVDNITIKAMIRAYARRQGIPVMTVADLGEKSIVDIERYDLGDVEPFNGKLDACFVRELESGRVLDERERMQALIRLMGGMREISPRVVAAAAAMKRGEIGGFPQPGATATAGAALADVAARDILLGRPVASGSYIHQPRDTLKLKRVDSLREVARIYAEFLHNRKT